MKKLKMGMVGGGSGALIGAVHRAAALMDGQVEFTAGALSSTPEKSLASGREFGLPDLRNYDSWERMLEAELSLPPGERIDFVSVVTPNHMHHPVARAFAEAGFNVVLDKPMVHTSEQAEDLAQVVEGSGVVFAVSSGRAVITVTSRGSSDATTVTVKLPLSERLPESVTEQLTVVVPNLKVLPEAGSHFGVSAPSCSSLAVAV